MSLLERSRIEPNDAELISRVRGGDSAAYGVLFERHRDSANRLARGLARGGDSDDLVSEAFARVLTVLQQGGGPDLSFRAYLLTSVRRIHIDRIRSTRRSVPTDDIEALDSGVAFEDPAVAGFEGSAAARAYASLPERWQLVLWHLEVEGQKPADVAPLLGLSPNSVSVLAYRAREGLRQAFLQQHAADIKDQDCEWTRGKLGAYVRRGLSKRDGAKVETHLEGCRPCTAVYLELAEVNSSLGAVLGPLVLGSTAAAYLGAAPAGASVLLALLGRGRDFIVGNSQTALIATAATAVTAVGIGGLVIANQPDAPTASTTGPAPAKVTPHTQDRSAPPAPPEKTGPVPAVSSTSAASPAAVPPPGPPPARPTAGEKPADPRAADQLPSAAQRPSKSTGQPPNASPTPPVPPGTEPADPPLLRVGLMLGVLDSPQDGSSGNAIRSTVQAEVSGLPGSKTTRLKISLDAGVQSVQLPEGCTEVDDLNATCVVANGATVFHVVHKDRVRIRVTGPGVMDTRVVLPGRA